MFAFYVLFQGGNFFTWELTEATEKLCHHTAKAFLRLNQDFSESLEQLSLSQLNDAIKTWGWWLIIRGAIK